MKNSSSIHYMTGVKLGKQVYVDSFLFHFIKTGIHKTMLILYPDLLPLWPVKARLVHVRVFKKSYANYAYKLVVRIRLPRKYFCETLSRATNNIKMCS